MILLESTAVHIPLLDQCCFFNVSVSCLCVGAFFNLTGQTSLTLTLVIYPSLLSYSLLHFFWGKPFFKFF